MAHRSSFRSPVLDRRRIVPGRGSYGGKEFEREGRLSTLIALLEKSKARHNTKAGRLAAGFFLVMLLAAANVSAAPGDQLFIKGETVNVRSGPGTSFAVVVKLVRGQELIEFGRRDEWINVGVARPGGRAGWVHSSLVSRSMTGGETNTSPDP